MSYTLNVSGTLQDMLQSVIDAANDVVSTVDDTVKQTTQIFVDDSGGQVSTGVRFISASLKPRDNTLSLDLGDASLKFNNIYANNFKGTADLATAATKFDGNRSIFIDDYNSSHRGNVATTNFQPGTSLQLKLPEQISATLFNGPATSLNSGSVGASKNPVYFNSSGKPVASGYWTSSFYNKLYNQVMLQNVYFTNPTDKEFYLYIPGMTSNSRLRLIIHAIVNFNNDFTGVTMYKEYDSQYTSSFHAHGYTYCLFMGTNSTNFYCRTKYWNGSSWADANEAIDTVFVQYVDLNA